MGLVTAELPR